MKKYVVISTNNNPDYYFYAPYQEKAWNSLGWSLCVMVTRDVDIEALKLSNPSTVIIRMAEHPHLRGETVAQASRLYAANFFDADTLLMTCDMDLIPLANYWNPSVNDITIYGHDLTWHSFYPMGYIAMTAANWHQYMKLTGDTEADMNRDAKEYEHLTSSDNWESWWNYDWQIITDRLKPFKDRLTFIDRGQINIAGATLAKGRVDRFNFIETQKQPDLIDAHCENNNVKHPSKLEPFLELYNKYYK